VLLRQVDDPVAERLVVHEPLDRGVHVRLGDVRVLVPKGLAEQFLERILLSAVLSEAGQEVADLVRREVVFPDVVPGRAGLLRGRGELRRRALRAQPQGRTE
jgi:hypothetical protein